MRKVKLISISLLLIILFGSLVGFRIKQRNDAQAALKKSKSSITPVSIIYPKVANFDSFLTVSGQILPQEEIQLTPKSNGRLIKLLVEEGNIVKTGQLIGEVDHSEIDAQITQAQAQAKIAKANLMMAINGAVSPQIAQAKTTVLQSESSILQLKANKQNLERDLARYKILTVQGAISYQQLNNTQTQISVIEQQIQSSKQQLISSQQALKILTDGTRPEQLDVNKGQLESANATIDLYKAQLENYHIISPINGVVSKKFLYTGSIVSSTTPIITISKNIQPDIVMNIPEKEISKVHVGQTVNVKDSSDNTTSSVAIIKSINPSVDIQTRLITVRAKMNKKSNLKLGMLLECSIVTTKDQKHIILPADAVIKNDDKNIVYTAVNNKAVLNNVIIGQQNSNQVEIIQGLNKDDKIILKGNVFVNSGDDIEIKPEIKVKK